MLDWELAHVGDPVEDLGWLCVPAWRFARPDRPAAGLGTREELLDAYERHAGVAVDPAALRWWELAGTLRWGVICVMQAFTHLSGATRSVEHAVIGRRACEVEWDLLELLGPAPADAGPESRAAGGPARREAPALHDRPTTLELLEAARGALGDDVLPQLEGRAGLPAARRRCARSGSCGASSSTQRRARRPARRRAGRGRMSRTSVSSRSAIRDGTLDEREERRARGGPRHRAREARGRQPRAT